MKEFLEHSVLLFSFTGYTQDVYFQQSNAGAINKTVEITTLLYSTSARFLFE